MKLKNLVILFLVLAFSNLTFAQVVETKEEALKIHFSKKDIRVGKTTLQVEMAKTSHQQEYGLMFRQSLKDGTGMLFIFKKEEVLSFWMKNCLFPLSVGFFNAEKELVSIVDMEPASPMDNFPPAYSSQKAALYALEVPKGWFTKKEIKLGEKLSLSKGE